MSRRGSLYTPDETDSAPTLQRWGCASFPGPPGNLRAGAVRRHLPEHHRLRPVEQHPGLGVPAYGAGEHLALDVATGRDELGGVEAVVDARHVLLDDRALVEVAGHVVRRGADQLHAAVERLVVGPRTLEARQERVVDVDRLAGQLSAGVV